MDELKELHERAMELLDRAPNQELAPWLKEQVTLEAAKTGGKNYLRKFIAAMESYEDVP